MKDNKSTMRKTIGWISLAYGAFTAISIIGPLLLERVWSKRRLEGRPQGIVPSPPDSVPLQ
jgi:hypothetical protein